MKPSIRVELLHGGSIYASRRLRRWGIFFSLSRWVYKVAISGPIPGMGKVL
jgi:hypothetical protein